jgi:hypothetical protein
MATTTALAGARTTAAVTITIGSVADLATLSAAGLSLGSRVYAASEDAYYMLKAGGGGVAAFEISGVSWVKQSAVGVVDSVTATDATAIDNSDPQNPVVLQATAANGGSLRGQDFSKLVTVPDGGTLMTTYASLVASLKAGDESTLTVVMPTVVGLKFRATAGRWEIITKTGTATANSSMVLGQNGVDFTGTAMTFSLASSSVNSLGTVPVCLTANSIIPEIDTSAGHPLQIRIATGVAGVTTLTGRFIVEGYWT